jgi:hypothetical protein
MATLLVLGSKPDPLLPPASAFDDVACANASGHSAARYGLPVPRFTVISSILASGKNASNRLALEALRGLSTGRLYLFPRRPFARKRWKQLLLLPKVIRTSAPFVRRQLAASGYRFDEFVVQPPERYLQTVAELSGNDPGLIRLMREKVPSVGMLALAIGLHDYHYDRVILSGFSFEITHAYAVNPLIAERGSTASRHAETDITAFRLISRRHAGVLTTEPTVAARAEVPMLQE